MMKILKIIGGLMGVGIMIFSILGKISEIQWAVGILLAWGFVYSVKED